LLNSHLEQKNSTRCRAEMRCVVPSRADSAINGLELWLVILWSSHAHRTCIVRSFAHSYLDHVKKWTNCRQIGTGAEESYDTSALVPNCRMATSEPLPNYPDISDPSPWCRSVLGPKCLGSKVSVHRLIYTVQFVLCINSPKYFMTVSGRLKTAGCCGAASRRFTMASRRFKTAGYFILRQLPGGHAKLCRRCGRWSMTVRPHCSGASDTNWLTDVIDGPSSYLAVGIGMEHTGP